MGILEMDTAVICTDTTDTFERTNTGPRAVELQLTSIILPFLFHYAAVQFVFGVHRLPMASDTFFPGRCVCLPSSAYHGGCSVQVCSKFGSQSSIHGIKRSQKLTPYWLADYWLLADCCSPANLPHLQTNFSTEVQGKGSTSTSTKFAKFEAGNAELITLLGFFCLFYCLLWQEIDDCLVQAKDRSYDALVHFGKRGLNVAATAAVMAASKVKVGVRVVILASHPYPLPPTATVWRGRHTRGRDSLTGFHHTSQFASYSPATDVPLGMKTVNVVLGEPVWGCKCSMKTRVCFRPLFFLFSMPFSTLVTTLAVLFITACALCSLYQSEGMNDANTNTAP